MNMSDISTTKMTSKGQVVIPEEIREYMNLESGVKFIVMATSDSIIFKKITPISQKDIKQLLEATRTMAEKYNFKESEIPEVVKEVRSESRPNAKHATKAAKSSNKSTFSTTASGNRVAASRKGSSKDNSKKK